MLKISTLQRCGALVLASTTACGPLVALDDAGGGTDGDDGASSGASDTRPSSVGGDDRPMGEVGDEAGDEADDEAGEDVTTSTSASCGDGFVDDGEVCDDGNDTPGDGCELDCTATPGQQLWASSFDALGGNDIASAVAVTTDLRIMIVGTAEGDVDDDVWLRVQDTVGTVLTDTLTNAGSDDVGTSVVALPDGRAYVAGLQPDDDRALLLQATDGLFMLDGAPTDIAAFTALVTATSEGFVMLFNAGGFNDITPMVRRFDADGVMLGDAAFASGVFALASASLPDGGTVLGGARFGGMGMGGSVWLSALDAQANARWESEIPIEPGEQVRVRSLTALADGRIVGVGSQGLGGPGDESSTGWIWWWSSEGVLDDEGPLEIGGASTRPSSVVMGNHGLVIGGDLITIDDGFVAGLDANDELLWGYTLVGDLGAEDMVTALAVAPGVGIVAVGYATNEATGRDGWSSLFTD